MKKQYEAMYGRAYDDGGGGCTCKGFLKLLLLMLIAIVGMIAIFAYSNPDWEGWTVLMPVFPVSVHLKLIHEVWHVKL